MSYRPEVDGLRAVAVLPVILFHFGFASVSGGFVGVDVFFVISGYVITRTLVAADAGRFTTFILAFYARRVRRIVPALSVVIVASLAAGYALLLPQDYENLGRQAAWAAAGLSNIYFYTSTGYFERAAEFLPLLHTWSLGVEEQFYLVWPALLFFLMRFPRYVAPLVLGAVAIASLLAAEWRLAADPQGAFYLPHLRCWELALGALLVYAPQIKGRIINETLGLVGVLLIAYAIFFLDEKSPFPGLNALWPCLGAALIIGTAGTWTARLLSLSPVVFVGLISYSLYLWHWPIVVFFRIWNNGGVPQLHEAALLLALTATLSVLTWHAIEKPFRAGARTASAPRTLSFGFGAAAAVLLLGSTVSLLQGVPSRLPEAAQRFASFIGHKAPWGIDGLTCLISPERLTLEALDAKCLEAHTSKPTVLLIGDSHAGHFISAFQTVYPDVQFARLFATGCPPLVGATGYQPCVDAFQRAFDAIIPAARFDAIILSGRWFRANSALVKKLTATVEKLKGATSHVVVLGPTMEYRDIVPAMLARDYLPRRTASPSEFGSYARVKIIDDRLRDALKDIDYRSVADAICPAGDCKLTVGDNVPMEADQHHLTVEGATYVVQALKADGLAFRKRTDSLSQVIFGEGD